MTAKHFLAELSALKSKTELDNVQRFFRYEGRESIFIGVKMSSLFALAKKYTQIPLKEVEKLLDSDYYEARMGAVSIMDFKARNKKITPEEKKELFDLYISKHNCIDNWDMVDRSAPYVVGGYLYDKPRKILYKLAKSKNVWERRTAIVATYYFIRLGEVDETFKIAEILVKDKHDLIQKAVGSWVREAGKKDKVQLIGFLNAHVLSMPSVMIRYATEKLDKKVRADFLKKGKK